MRTPFLVSALLMLFGCTVEAPIPGDEVIGSFAFTAIRVEDGCSFTEAQESFVFDGTFSRESGSTRAYFTVNDVSHEGGFDGGEVHATMRVPRQFQACACTTSELEETIRVALVSPSQDARLGGRCPAAPFDGGVPAPDTEDGGIRATAAGETGFDALRACGELVDAVIPGEGCACAPCRMTYRLEGVRR